MAGGKFRLSRRGIFLQRPNCGASGLARKELRKSFSGIQFAFIYGVEFMN
jgi:hypothetical protein